MQPWIAEMEAGIGLPLVPALRALYEQADGEETTDPIGRPGPASQGRPMRLMSANEVLTDFDGLRSCGALRDSAPFFAGDNGERAAVFLRGPLKGRVYIFDYDGRNDSVAFRGVESFIDSMNEAAAAGEGWQDLRGDYYVATEYFLRGDAACKPASAADLAADARDARQLREEYAAATIRDERDDFHYALNIMALTPRDDLAALDEFLGSEDMWIQERACILLGHWRHAARVEKLGRIARGGTTNGRGAALDALGRIGTPAALEQVVASISQFRGGEQWRLSRALEGCGCETRKDNIDPRGINAPDYMYRLPGQSEWRKL